MNVPLAHLYFRQALPWATDKDIAAPASPSNGRKHVQYMPKQYEGFGQRVERPFPF